MITITLIKGHMYFARFIKPVKNSSQVEVDETLLTFKEIESLIEAVDCKVINISDSDLDVLKARLDTPNNGGPDLSLEEAQTIVNEKLKQSPITSPTDPSKDYDVIFNSYSQQFQLKTTQPLIIKNSGGTIIYNNSI